MPSISSPNEIENWRPLKARVLDEYGIKVHGWEVSDLGRVRNKGVIVPPILKTWESRGRTSQQPAIEIAPGFTPLLTTLVAEVWLPNPYGSRSVSRKDKRDIWNTRADNLEWRLRNERTRTVAPPNPNDPSEQWQPVLGAPGYEVSSEGRMRKDGKPLKPLIRRGEPTVFLHAPGGRVFGRLVKQLVADAFMRKPLGHEVRLSRAAGSDERSCRVADLLWVAEPAYRRGRRSPGKRAKLDAAKVREARARHAAGETQKSIAADFGVTPTAISLAVRGVNWRGV